MDRQIYAKTKVMVVLGTQPESIKAAPIIERLHRQENDFQTTIVATSQHRELPDQPHSHSLSLFHLRPDIVLNLTHPRQGLPALTSRVLENMTITLYQTKPDILLVLEDSTTAFASALAAFYQHIPVGHIAANPCNNTHDSPFPEEMNRRLTTVMAEIHFAPTLFAKQCLLSEGVSEKRIIITGNTVVDALMHFSSLPFSFQASTLQHIDMAGKRLVLVSMNPHESWNATLQNTCIAAKELVRKYPDIVVVYLSYPHSVVRKKTAEILEGVERIHLIDPPDLVTFANLVKKSYLIITDSAELKEEASTFKKPLLLLCDGTKKEEDFHTASAKVVDIDASKIIQETGYLLIDAKAYKKMIDPENPYGDGRAAERIVTALTRWSKGKQPLITPLEEFATQATGFNLFCQNL